MTLTPSTKTVYTAVGGALVTVLAFILTITTGLELPAEVGAALATIVTAIIALTVPARQGTYVDLDDDEETWDRDRDGLMANHASADEPETEVA